MTGADVFYGLSYVDDLFVAEANPLAPAKKNSNMLFAVCSAAAAVVIICAIMMALFFKGGFSDGKQPLTNAPVAEETDTEQEQAKAQLVIVSEEVPEEAFEHAKAAALEHMPTLLRAPGLFQIEYEENAHFYLGNGYYSYYSYDGELERSDTIEYPVLQNGRAVMSIYLFQTPEGWQSTASAGITEQLNAVIGDGEIYQAIAPTPYQNPELVLAEKIQQDSGYVMIEVISDAMAEDPMRVLGYDIIK